jgi:hypothetical protein
LGAAYGSYAPIQKSQLPSTHNLVPSFETASNQVLVYTPLDINPAESINRFELDAQRRQMSKTVFGKSMSSWIRAGIKPLLIIVSAFLLVIFSHAAPQLGKNAPEGRGENANAEQGEKRLSSPTKPAVVEEKLRETEPSIQDRQPEDKNTGREPHNWIETLNAFSTFVIAVFTVLLAVGVIFQIRDYRARERAWVILSIEHHPTLQVQQTGNICRFTGFIQNFGGTPATILDMGYFGDAINRGDQLPTEPYYLGEKRPEQTSYPLVPKGLIPASCDVLQSDMDKVRTGEMILYIFGFIKYQDTFRRTRETRYCFRYYPPIPGSIDVHVGYYPEGPPSYHKVT